MPTSSDQARRAPPISFTTERSFVNLPTEKKFETMVAELRAWKTRGRKTWGEARRFFSKLRVLAVDLNQTLDQAIESIETAVELDG